MFLEIKTFLKGIVDELMASPFHTMTKTGDTKDRREMKDGECREIQKPDVARPEHGDVKTDSRADRSVDWCPRGDSKTP